MSPRPYSKRYSRWTSFLLLLVALAVFAARRYSEETAPQQAPRPSPASPQSPAGDPTWVGAQPGEYRVRRAVDGDTLLLEDGQRVRLIGVDTPESVKPDTPVEPWGPEASNFTKQFLREARNTVRLEFDRERTDDYGRLLAYVYAGERMLNEELLRQGLGTALLRHPYAQAMKDRFKAAQREAQQANRGIWSNEP